MPVQLSNICNRVQANLLLFAAPTLTAGTTVQLFEYLFISLIYYLGPVLLVSYLPKR